MAETNQTLENLSKTSTPGLFAIFRISEYFKKAFTFKDNASTISIVISLIFVIIFYLTKIDVYEAIVEISNLIIDFVPGILGFTISGYALTVGFVQSGMLTRISEKLEDSDYSLYQKMSSTFALCIILQALSLFLAYIYHFLEYIQENSKNTLFELSENCISCINGLGVFLILVAFWLSLILSIQVVINIFDFSQLHHFLINKDKLKKP